MSCSKIGKSARSFFASSFGGLVTAMRLSYSRRPGLQALRVAHEVERAPLDLVVDAGDVLAHDPDQQELDSAEERDEDRDRGETGHLVEAGDLRDEEDDAEQEGEARHEEADLEGKPQGVGGEADDPVARKPDHLPERVLRLARVPLLAAERNPDLAVADPAEHAAHVAVRLPHRAERVEGSAIDETEVADVERNVDVAHPPEEAVEGRSRRALERRVALPLLTDGVDDVVTVAPARGELERDLRRVLQVGVHHDHGVTGRDVQAGGDGDLVSEVPGEPQELEARVGGPRRAHPLVARIARPIVDQNHLRGPVEAVEEARQAAHELRYRVLLVVDRDDERVFGLSWRGHPSILKRWAVGTRFRSADLCASMFRDASYRPVSGRLRLGRSPVRRRARDL